MEIKKAIRDKWLDRVKQYGLTVAYIHIVRAIMRSIYLKTEYIVVAIVDRRHEKFDSANVSILTPSLVEIRKTQWKLPSSKMRSLRASLANDCMGFMIENDGKLAAYACVQYSGIYKFGKTGKFSIPKDMAVLKDLYVFSEYRGENLGKELNRARILAIPEGITPLGFVIPENRYAIRNLAINGFIDILKIRRTTWFRCINRQKVFIIKDLQITRRIMEGLEKG